MFRPIKNLINYIQKNASGFGTTGNSVAAEEKPATEAADVAEDSPTRETSLGLECGDNSEGKAVLAEKPHNHLTSRAMEEHEARKNGGRHDTVKDGGGADGARASVDGSSSPPEIILIEDDFELQIKSSSIMVRKPLNRVIESKVGVDENVDVGEAEPLTSKQSEMMMSAVEEEELSHFRHGPTFSKAKAVGGQSATKQLYETECNDFAFNDGDDIDALDVGPKIEAFTGSEVIDLTENDLNSSTASDAPSEDPLAIDELMAARATNDVGLEVISLDSSTADEATASDDVLWLNIEHIKTTETGDYGGEGGGDENGNPAKETKKELDAVPGDKTGSNEELRSDVGSDSGLGSENTTLHSSLISATDVGSSQVACEAAVLPVDEGSSVDALLPAVVSPKKPLRSNLKRRLEDYDLDVSASCSGVSVEKKPKRNINFDSVQVYYFPRQQGFGCVPSVGGCTLGMGARHVAFKTLSLAEHAAELRRQHRMQLQDIQPRGSSSEDSETSEEDYLSDGASSSDADAENNGFLQPVSPKQRRALLKAAGVRKIDAGEKSSCRDIRNSRETCGCSCRDFCDPETCSCSQAGIKCQVDRAMFPCGCSREACGNVVGRVEFNPARVRTHFIHTVMRLEMENRQQQNPTVSYSAVRSSAILGSQSSGYDLGMAAAAAAAASSGSNYYGQMQPQSNYSSGYASPAYTSDQSASTPSAAYYQPQSPGLYVAANVGNSSMTAAAAAPTTTTQYPLDSIDDAGGSLYPTAMSTTTATYAEILPSYGSSAYHQNLGYGSNGAEMLSQLSAYATYHHSGASNYMPPQSASVYRSCAVPSEPPYGSATTTAISVQYQNTVTHSLATASDTLGVDDSTGSRATEAAMIDVGMEEDIDVGGRCEGNNSSSFIDLNTAIPSSSRLLQINDLLQNNRNTTAALVAVSAEGPLPPLLDCGGVGNRINSGTKVCLNINDSIDTALSFSPPPLENSVDQGRFLAFESLPPPLIRRPDQRNDDESSLPSYRSRLPSTDDKEFLGEATEAHLESLKSEPEPPPKALEDLIDADTSIISASPQSPPLVAVGTGLN